MPTPPPYVSTRPHAAGREDPPAATGRCRSTAAWRSGATAGTKPQIVVTPEIVRRRRSTARAIAAPSSASPTRASDLYAQFLVFDDVVSFHQDVSRHYKQDGVEMCLNGFQAGFKFDATDHDRRRARSSSANRFFFQKLDWAMPESHAPRSIKVLDDARDVPERDLIEGVYGVDMSESRVIVIEFKLPIDAVTYKDSAKELKDDHPLGPGPGVLARLPDQRQRRARDRRAGLTSSGPRATTISGPPGRGARAVLE